MNVNNKKLAGLKSKYNGYISGKKIDRFFDEFGIKSTFFVVAEDLKSENKLKITGSGL